MCVWVLVSLWVLEHKGRSWGWILLGVFWVVLIPSKKLPAQTPLNTCANCGAQYDKYAIEEYNALERCCHNLPSLEQKALWSYRINGVEPLRNNGISY
jgi:hypothetical protein